MSSIYIRYPTLGSGSGGVAIYATLADFPATAPTGTLAVAADSGILYEYFGGSWMAVAAPGDVLSLGAFGSTPNADGLSIAANVLNMQPANQTYPGGVSITTQTFAGQKTFNNLAVFRGMITSSNTTAAAGRNEGFGFDAGYQITTGTDNTTLGYQAGQNITTALQNTAIGSGALASLSVTEGGDGNTAVGYQALTAQTTSPGYNTALGYQAGAALTSGFQNTVFGYQSLNASSQAELVCAIGQGAFANCINISNAVGIGASAGFNSTSSYVTYVGAQCGQSASGNFSTSIGYQSLMDSSGVSSIGLGIFAGINSSGSNTLYIGDTTQDPSAYAINTVVVASSNAGGANWTQNQTFSGTVNLSALTASTALALDSSKNIVSSSTTFTELSYVHGVSSAIQTQLNALQPSGNYITALTGDATASGPGSAALTLATVNTNTGSFGSSTSIPNFTVNGKGLITAAGSNVVIAPAGTLSGTTLNSSVVTSSLTAVGTIVTGTWEGTTIAIANGGTGQITAPAAFNALSPITTTGDMIYSPSGATSQRLPIGSTNQVLTVIGGVPSWQPSSGGSLTVPTTQVFTSGSGTYTTPTSPAPLYIKIRLVGGGGGGGGSGTAPGNATNGGDTSFSTLTGGGGQGSTNIPGGNVGGIGGTASGGYLNVPGGQGTSSDAGVANGLNSGNGADSLMGQGGTGGIFNANGNNASGYGGGGGGASNNGTTTGAPGAGSGGYVEQIIGSPSATYSYGVGAAGVGGSAGSGGNAGGNGSAGIIIVNEYYQ